MFKNKKMGRIQINLQEGQVFFVLIWRPRGSDRMQGCQAKVPTAITKVHSIQNKIALHRIGEKGHGGQRAAMAALL